MSNLMRKESASATGSIIEHVNSGNSNASSLSSHDEYDDEAAAAAVSMSPAFKSNAITATNSILTNLSRLNAHHLNATGNSGYRKEMGGFSLPHHSISAAFYGYHSHASQLTADNCSANATGAMAQPSQASPTHSYGASTSTIAHNANGAIGALNGSGQISSNNGIVAAGGNNAFNTSKSAPFLLPAQLYKSLFANAVLHNPDKMCSRPFPRNLLFSYSDKSPNSPEFEHEEKHSVAEEVSSHFGGMETKLRGSCSNASNMMCSCW